jgi:hypothetical protein
MYVSARWTAQLDLARILRVEGFASEPVFVQWKS